MTPQGGDCCSLFYRISLTKSIQDPAQAVVADGTLNQLHLEANLCRIRVTVRCPEVRVDMDMDMDVVSRLRTRDGTRVNKPMVMASATATEDTPVEHHNTLRLPFVRFQNPRGTKQASRRNGLNGLDHPEVVKVLFAKLSC